LNINKSVDKNVCCYHLYLMHLNKGRCWWHQSRSLHRLSRLLSIEYSDCNNKLYI